MPTSVPPEYLDYLVLVIGCYDSGNGDIGCYDSGNGDSTWKCNPTNRCLSGSNKVLRSGALCEPSAIIAVTAVSL